MAGEAIFIGYRREDTADVAGRMHDALSRRFGRRRIFMDVDNIRPGVDFGAHLRSLLLRCRVVLVLIGPHWLDARDERGARRLDDPNDWVRIEIETALATPGLDVVPVLINGARFPRAEELPESLAPLLRRHAAVIRRNPDFHDDVQRLATALRASLRTGVLDFSAPALAAMPTTQSSASRRWLLPVTAMLLGLVAVLAWQPWRMWGGDTADQGQAVAPAHGALASVRRGWIVYNEVCSSCHEVGGVTYASLGEEGGPLWDAQFPEPDENPYVLETAQAVEIPVIGPGGALVTRTGVAEDEIRRPFPDVASAALANGGAVPPDLAFYARRNEAQSIERILLGYSDPPAGVVTPAGAYFNVALRPGGGFIRMAPPLQDGMVEYPDDTPASPTQMARDVSAFLAWTKNLGARRPTPGALALAAASNEQNFEMLFAGDRSEYAHLVERGRILARQCVSCHRFEPGEGAGVGPNLYAIFERPIAASPGFQYSSALLAVNGRWNGAALDAYLRAPGRAAPGTSMSYVGIADEQDRLAMIAYLYDQRPAPPSH